MDCRYDMEEDGSLDFSSSNSPYPSPSTPGTELSTLFDDGYDYFSEALPKDDSRYVLVTGGLGYIGSHTTLELLRSGYNVIVIDNLSNSYPIVFHRIKVLATKYYEMVGKSMPLLRFYNADYRDRFALKSILDAYILRPKSPSCGSSSTSQIIGVIHFAASKAVEESIHQPLHYYANNVGGLVDFCSILGEYGIKSFVFSSSAAVYGAAANSSTPLREELCVHQPEVYTDDDGEIQTAQSGCRGLTSPYSRTKWMCEAILSDLCVADPSWTVIALRYFNPIGCDSSGMLGEKARGTPSNLMPTVARVITGDLPILSVYGADYDTKDGTAVRDFIHVTDLARGHIAALVAAAEERIRGPFRAFNLGSGHGHSVLDVVKAMECASRKKISYRTIGRRPGDLSSCVAKTQRAEEELSWTIERPLKTCSKDICNFLVVNGLVAEPSV
ncbi:hypothetical protein FGG08_005697 [Glutinoglossum americanum]|uniref:NAD-dependent epimerase/dehydratase domain-containing protein n=1 Tax=Glutinoglossum americanum TaxID=1670608 RepID=A0A9P8L167_9PEZI|nr:hypothetical protein FGG08_005697 [Glutinoglossum americanum]